MEPTQLKAHLFGTVIDSTLHLLVNNGFTMNDIAQFSASLMIRALSKVELCEPGTFAKLEELKAELRTPTNDLEP